MSPLFFVIGNCASQVVEVRENAKHSLRIVAAGQQFFVGGIILLKMSGFGYIALYKFFCGALGLRHKTSFLYNI